MVNRRRELKPSSPCWMTCSKRRRGSERCEKERGQEEVSSMPIGKAAGDLAFQKRQEERIDAGRLRIRVISCHFMPF